MKNRNLSAQSSLDIINSFIRLIDDPYDAVFIEKLDGKIVEVNTAACEMLQYSREELLAMNVADLLPPQARETTEEMLHNELRTGGRSFSGYNVRKDGVQIPVEVFSRGFVDNDEHYLLVIIRDITNRLIGEKALRKSEYLTALHEISVDLLNRLELKDVLTNIMKRASNLFDTPDGFICLTKETDDRLTQIIGIGANAATAGFTFAMGEGLIGEVAQSGTARVVENYHVWAGRNPNYAYDNIQTAVGIPLKIGGRVVGVIGISFYDMARRFTEEELAVFSQFAELASIALANANLHSALAESENSYRTVFDASTEAIELYDAETLELVDANQKAAERQGLTCAEFKSRGLAIFAEKGNEVPYTREDALPYLRRAANGEHQQLEWRIGKDLWLDIRLKKVKFAKRDCVMVVMRDITERKINELALRKSEADKQALINAIPDPMLTIRRDGTIVEGIGQLEYMSVNAVDLVGKNIAAVLPQPAAEYFCREMGSRFAPGKVKTFEYEIPADGNAIYFEARGVCKGEDECLIILRNISERKVMEVQLRYLGLHDALTGLYNRAFFEAELERLKEQPALAVGLLICDVDGLKMVNDVFGHSQGDALLKEVAYILKKAFPAGGVVARIGGDEFAVLLSGNPVRRLRAGIHKAGKSIIRRNANNHSLPISISMGFAVSRKAPLDTVALFKEADDNMYKEKLQQRSIRNNILQVMVKNLEIRDFMSEDHLQHFFSRLEAFAAAVGLSETETANLLLLAKFHDIGKIGVPEEIIFKPEKLTAEEVEQMRKHCSIGYRIAKALPELQTIAEWIYKHHEYWDGNGYPNGLKGEAIPLPCRLFSIVNAFETMTSIRPYSKTKSEEEAIAEITGLAGSKFDPRLVRIFVKLHEH